MNNLEENKKLSIICFSGSFDKLVAAFTLATGAAAVNYDVHIFFTFWGLNAIKNGKGRKLVGKGAMAMTFNYLMGGVNNVPLSRLNFFGISPKLMNNMMKKRNAATLKELVQAAIDLDVNLYSCEMSMNILGIKKGDFIPQIKEVIGVPRFLEYSAGGERIFI